MIRFLRRITETKQQFLILCAILGAGAYARLIYLLNVYTSARSWDAANYYEAAWRLLREGYYALGSGPIGSHPNAVTMPGYTFFLAPIFKVVGQTKWTLPVTYLVQLGLSVATIVLIYLIAKRLADIRTGLIAAGIAAFYTPFWYSMTKLYTETLYMFVFCVALLLGLRFFDRPSLRGALSLGVIAGVTTYIRPAGALWFVVPFAIALVWKKARLADLLRYGVLALVVAVLIISPWWVRNYLRYDQFIPLTTASANPRYVSSFWPALPPSDASIWPTSESADEALLNARWDAAADQRLAEQFAADPKAFRATRVYMIKEALLRHYEWNMMSIYMVSMRLHQLLLALAWLGMLARSRKGETWVVASFWLLSVITYSMIYIDSRYMLVTWPVLCGFSAIGGVWAWQTAAAAWEFARERVSEWNPSNLLGRVENVYDEGGD